ncbi:MAG: hypothetical protein AMJ95_01130 [Omnitrophica WOR_2 bacterium SM23_72]|nr:MAG: hypothetical protein AMJ95_01130 [Omnitrophica WOR_2 bacterium SM23_72]
MNCFLTGGTGFIGRHLARELLKRGHNVRILARRKNALGKLADLITDVHYGDITDKASIRNALNAIEVIFHCAGLLGHQFGISKSQYYNINVLGTKNLVELSCQENIKKFIFCSSAGVIGPTGSLMANERWPYNPTNAYEWSKMKAEKIVQKSGLNYVILRP